MPAASPALSRPRIATRERLIFALDTPDIDHAKRLVETLDAHVHFFKVGLELFLADGARALPGWLGDRGKRTFVDLKFFDVPRTVAAAVRQLDGGHAAFATVHGNDAMLEAACEARGDTRILAVTALTSLDQGDLDDLGFAVDLPTLVLSRARRALAIGCDGVVSSGLEVARLRRELGEGLVVVVPGIRPVANRDDQKRTVDVEEAFLNGADHIVVGRPIRDAADPAAAAADIQRRIHALFAAA